MKIILAIIPFLLCAIHLNGQPKTMKHLMKDKRIDISPFINPTFQFSQIALQYCNIPGIRAGVIFNRNLLIGGVYNFSSGDIALPVLNGAGKLQMKWGGLHLEYTFWPLQVVHLTLPLSTGMGKMKISGGTIEPMTGNPNFFFAEPGLMLEINVWKYAKFGIGGNYRYTGNVSYNKLTSKDLNGFSAVASLKFGLFNYPELKKNIRDPLEEDINAAREKKINDAARKKMKAAKKKINSPRGKKRKSPR